VLGVAELADLPARRQPRQARARRIELDVGRVGALEVMHRALLRLGDRLRAAVHPAPGEADVRDPRVVGPPVLELRPAGVRLIVQGRLEVRAVELAVDRGRRHADRGLALAEVTLDPGDRVVGQRRHDREVPRDRRVRRLRHERLGGLLAGDGVEHADRPAAARLAGQLRGAVDRRRARRSDVVVVGVGLGRLRADPPAVEGALDAAVAEANRQLE
jgi:hypothetical protein